MPPKAYVAKAAHWVALHTGASAHLAARSPSVRIIMFHGVDGQAYPLAGFEKQLRYLQGIYRVVSLEKALEELASGQAGTGCAVLTFDDGLRNNYTNVYPVLRRLRLPAVFYVCPGLIGAGKWLWNHEARARLRTLPDAERGALAARLGAPGSKVEAIVEWMKRLQLSRRTLVEDALRAATDGFCPSARQRLAYDLMSWEELGELDPELITIGSHGLTHAILTGLEPEALQREVQESRSQLERRLGRSVEHFCYPDGAIDDPVVDCVRQHYRSAVTTAPGFAGSGDDRHLLRRVATAARLPLFAWRLHRPTA